MLLQNLQCRIRMQCKMEDNHRNFNSSRDPRNRLCRDHSSSSHQCNVHRCNNSSHQRNALSSSNSSLRCNVRSSNSLPFSVRSSSNLPFSVRSSNSQCSNLRSSNRTSNSSSIGSLHRFHETPRRQVECSAIQRKRIQREPHSTRSLLQALQRRISHKTLLNGATRPMLPHQHE